MSDDAVRDQKLKKNKKSAALTKHEFFTDFLVDLFTAHKGQTSQNPFVQRAQEALL